MRIVHQVIGTFLIQQAGLKRTETHTGAVTLIQRIHLHCLVLDGVYPTTAALPVSMPCTKFDASVVIDGQPQPSMIHGEVLNKLPSAAFKLAVVCPDHGETIYLAPELRGSHPCRLSWSRTAHDAGRRLRGDHHRGSGAGIFGGLCVKHKRVKTGSLWIHGFAV